VRGIFIFSLLITIICIFGVGSELRKAEIEQNKPINMSQVQSLLYWNSSKYAPIIELNLTDYSYNISKVNSVRFKNMIYKTADWIGYVMFEVGNWGIEYGYYHGEDINYRTLIAWLPRLIYLIIFLILIPVIIPIMALIYIIIAGLVVLVKKLKKKRKEKKK